MMNNSDERMIALERELEAMRVRCRKVETALQEEREARQAFVSLVTHELRVPMTSIKGYTDLLLKGIMGPVNESQHSFLETIRANVERMSRMVADLSDINKIEGDRLKIALEPVEVEPAVEEAVASIREASEDKSQILQVSLPSSLPPVRCDRARFIQVLKNVLRNAVQYTPEGGAIDVVVNAENDALKVAVQDDGIGILEDEQDRIFEQFFRASDEETRKTPGNGLALHLSRQLLALQDGHIGFESERGMGSSFYFTLPLARD